MYKLIYVYIYILYIIIYIYVNPLSHACINNMLYNCKYLHASFKPTVDVHLLHQGHNMTVHVITALPFFVSLFIQSLLHF